MYTARCGCGGAKLEVEATEHEVWRSTPLRSAAAGGRRWAVGGSQWTTEMAWAKSRRRGEKGEGGSCSAPYRILGDELLLEPWLGMWWRLAPGHEVVRCFELSTDAGVRQGGSAPVPKAQGGSGRGAPSPQFGTRGGGAEGVIVFFFAAFHTISLWPWLRSSRLPRVASKVMACIYEAPLGVVVWSRGFQRW